MKTEPGETGEEYLPQSRAVWLSSVSFLSLLPLSESLEQITARCVIAGFVQENDKHDPFSILIRFRPVCTTYGSFEWF